MSLKFYKVFLKFSLIGSLVFFIDYFICLLLQNFIVFSISRILSYFIATFFAWKFNSIVTFKKKSSFLIYLMGSIIAGIQNIFISLILFNVLDNQFISIGIGCLYGLFFNYLFQKEVTFS
jgi:putative flippase GtrA